MIRDIDAAFASRNMIGYDTTGPGAYAAVCNVPAALLVALMTPMRARPQRICQHNTAALGLQVLAANANR